MSQLHDVDMGAARRTKLESLDRIDGVIDRYLWRWKCRRCGVYFNAVQDVATGAEPPEVAEERIVRDVQAMLGNALQECPTVEISVTSEKHELRLRDTIPTRGAFQLVCVRCLMKVPGGQSERFAKEIEAAVRRADANPCSPTTGVST